ARGLRQRFLRGRLLALEPLETREAAGSLLAPALGGNLFGPFADDPFAAASQARLVSPSRTGVAILEPGRPSSKRAPPFRDGGGASRFSERDGSRAAEADTPRARGTGTHSLDAGLFGDPLALPGFGPIHAGAASGGAAAGKGGGSSGGGGGSS